MPSIQKPRALVAGDLVRLVSPASPLAKEKTEAAVKLLEGAGYRVDFGAHAFDEQSYLAGGDETRAADLQEAFDSDAAAVFCTRGGYGSARLFPYLDLDRMANSGKMFLGFSDVTTLHLALNRRGLATVHAPMALTLHYERPPWVIESFLAILRGAEPIPPEAPKGTSLVGGSGEGTTTGGCLCLLTDSIGTPDPLSGEGKIVLIEDVDENPHRIDAMLTHLLNARVLEGANGIVVGEMTRTDERTDAGIGGRPWREIVEDRLAPLGIPTIVDFPFGHSQKGMLSLPLGIRARIDAEQGTLSYQESLCA